MKGKELIETDTLNAGDIGALSKLTYTQTNDTLCTLDYRVVYEPITFSHPYLVKRLNQLVRLMKKRLQML